MTALHASLMFKTACYNKIFSGQTYYPITPTVQDFKDRDVLNIARLMYKEGASEQTFSHTNLNVCE